MAIITASKVRLLVILLAGFLLAHSAVARERTKVGVALSGGGAKGLAHIGVLKVLEEINMPVDYLTGTSMGSIIGGLYAVGYSAAQLDSLAKNLDWFDLFSDAVDRRQLTMEQKFRDGRYVVSLPFEERKIRLPAGLISGQKIIALLSRLTVSAQHIEDFREFPIPFSCVATNIVTGEAVLLDHGDLAEAIRASIAIPSIFTPVKINSLLLVDGGVVRNFPVEDVRHLGADIVIGVDVSSPLSREEELNSFIKIAEQSARFTGAESIRRQRQLCDILVLPEISEYSIFSFAEASELVAIGERAAREQLPRLKALADSLNRGAPRRPIAVLEPLDSVYVSRVEFKELKHVSRQLVQSELNIRPPRWVSVAAIEEGIERIYRTNFFQRVYFHLSPSENGSILNVKTVPKSESLFRVGFHYDSKTDASLLLNTTFQNLLAYGSKLHIDVRLGNDFQFDAQYYLYSGLYKNLGALGRLNFTQGSFDIFEESFRTARFNYDYTFFEPFIGTLFSQKIVIGGGLRAEYFKEEPSIAGEGLQEAIEKFVTFRGLIRLDTFERTFFPSEGIFLNFVNEGANRNFLSDVTFSRHTLDLRVHIPFHPRWSFLSSIYLGATTGETLPNQYLFFLGGVNHPVTLIGDRLSFLGFKLQEFTGPHVQMAQMGVQYEFLPNRLILLRLNAGNTFEEWNFDLTANRFVAGGGITIGAITPIGPLDFTIMRSYEHNFLTHLNIGYKF